MALTPRGASATLAPHEDGPPRGVRARALRVLGHQAPRASAGERHPGISRAHRAPPSAFARLRDRILDRWLAEEPSIGRGAGLHELDGKVADYSAAGIAARRARV